MSVSRVTTWKDRNIEPNEQSVSEENPKKDLEDRPAWIVRVLKLVAGVAVLGLGLAALLLISVLLLGGFKDDVIQIDPGTTLVPEPTVTVSPSE